MLGVTRRLLPNDPEGLRKAYVELGGASSVVLDAPTLAAIVNGIFDYEDEKYKRTKKGVGRDYTRKALAELTHASSFSKWQARYDPAGVMSSRDGWANSEKKMAISAHKDGAWLAFPFAKSGWYPSFADLFRIFRVWPSSEEAEAIVRGFVGSLV